MQTYKYSLEIETYCGLNSHFIFFLPMYQYYDMESNFTKVKNRILHYFCY